MARTIEEELADLEKQVEEKKTAIAAKYRMLEVVGDIGEYAPPFVHYHKLYGRDGSINFRIQRYSSIAEGKSPDMALLEKLIVEFPPVDMVTVKDRSRSFRPKGEWKGEVTEIDPVIIRIDNIERGAEAAFHWNAVIGNELWEISVECYLHTTDLGSISLDIDRYPDGEVRSVRRCEFAAKHGASIIKWGSGSNKTPNSFTLYWLQGKMPDISELFKS